MRTFLVAVVAESHEDVHKFLASSDVEVGVEGSPIDCWWVAEDGREDGSDNDSAILVPRGSQEDMYALIENHFEAHRDEWDEEGYPYAETDFSGRYLSPETRDWLARCDRGEPLVGELRPHLRLTTWFDDHLTPETPWHYRTWVHGSEFEITSGSAKSEPLARLRAQGAYNAPQHHCEVSEALASIRQPVGN